MTIFVIFPYLPGSDSQVFQGVTIFVGLLISLGSASAVSNMVAGLVITYMRPFKIGDKVKIGEVSGEVLEKSLLVTRLRTIKNEDITVPNASVLSGHTVNYSSVASNMGLIVHTTVTIGYDVPWKKVHELLLSAAKETKINVPLVVRLAGTNFLEGKKILDNSGLEIISASDLSDAAEKIVKEIK